MWPRSHYPRRRTDEYRLGPELARRREQQQSRSNHAFSVETSESDGEFRFEAAIPWSAFGTAELAPVDPLYSAATGALDTAYYNVVAGKSDINTALCEAEESTNKKINTLGKNSIKGKRPAELKQQVFSLL